MASLESGRYLVVVLPLRTSCLPPANTAALFANPAGPGLAPTILCIGVARGRVGIQGVVRAIPIRRRTTSPLLFDHILNKGSFSGILVEFSMANTTGIIQDLTAKLKVAAGPWRKDIKDTVDQLASALETLLPMTMPSEPIVKHALSVATFSFIFHERILLAFKTKSIKQKRAWEIIAQAVLDGVLDHLDDNNNGNIIFLLLHAIINPHQYLEKEKDAVAQAFYSTIGSIFFSFGSAISPTTCNAKLRTLAYSLLSTSCEAHPRNQEKLRNKHVLGSERLGYAVSITKGTHIIFAAYMRHSKPPSDYLALEQLLDLLARLIPPTKGTSKGRGLRMQFITEVFLIGARHLAEGSDIVKFLEYIPSSNWEETSAQVVQILARDMSFPQPFHVKEVSIAGVSFPQTPPSDRLYVDSDSLLANSLNEDDVYDVIRIPFSSIQQVMVADDGMVHVLTSRPVKVGDKEAPSRAPDEQPIITVFQISSTDMERFARAIGARGLVRAAALVYCCVAVLTPQYRHAGKTGPAERSSYHQTDHAHFQKCAADRTGIRRRREKPESAAVVHRESEDRAAGRCVLPHRSPASTRISLLRVYPRPSVVDLHDHSDDGPPPETHVDDGADGESPLLAQERGADVDTSPDARQPRQTQPPNGPARAAKALADERVPDIPETVQERQPEPDRSRSAAVPPVRARPAGRPASRSTRAPADGPERPAADGLPAPAARDAPARRSASQERHDAVFGTSDEELSDLSGDEHPRARSRPPADVLRARRGSRHSTRPATPDNDDDDDADHVPPGGAHDRDAAGEEPAGATERAAQDEELGPVVKVQRRTVVSQDDRKGTGDEKKNTAKTTKKKRAVESEEEDAVVVVEPASKTKSAVVGKPTKKGPAGRSGGGKKAAAAKKSNGKKRARAEAGSDSGSAVVEREAPAPRGRSSRSAAAAASKKIAQNVKSDNGDVDVIDGSETETGAKLGGKTGRCTPFHGRSLKFMLGIETVGRPDAAVGGRRDEVEPISLLSSTESPPAVVPAKASAAARKRKRGGNDEDAPAAPSSPLPDVVSPLAKRPRVQPDLQPPTPPRRRPSKDGTARSRPPAKKKYGHRAAKQRTSSPLPSAPYDVDYDELPGLSTAAPKVNDSSSPAPVISSTGKSKVAGMKAKGAKGPTAASKKSGNLQPAAAAKTEAVCKNMAKAVANKSSMLSLMVDLMETTASSDEVPSPSPAPMKKPMKDNAEAGSDLGAATKDLKSDTKAANVSSHTTKSNMTPWLAEENEPRAALKEPDEHIMECIDLQADDGGRSLPSDDAADAHASAIEEFTDFDEHRSSGDIRLSANPPPKTMVGTKVEFAGPKLSKLPEPPAPKAKKPPVTIDLTADEDEPVRPKARPIHKAPRPPALPAPPNPKTSSPADEDNDITIAPQDVSTSTYEEAYDDFLVPLNSSGQLFSPTDKTTTTSESEPQGKQPAPVSGKIWKKNVSFASMVEVAAEEEEKEQRQPAAAKKDDSGVFWLDQSVERPPAKEQKRILRSRLPEVKPRIAPSPAAKMTMTKPRKHVDIPDRFDSIANTEEGRDMSPIAYIIDRIANVVKEKIESGFDGVSRSTREAQRRTLHYAMEELREVGKSNAPTYNSLVNLEEAYGAYSRNVISALDEAIRVSDESRQHIQHVIQEHDRGVQAYSKFTMKRRELPPSVKRWL
ncbi:hypothetical protein EVG20_g9653 [Dentipellis fragilis]|uniref:Uncharacterized protein n=1 Tax=Dentipellis fragilis TaxID=205917 RepID=A0A4Y9XY38_9AGAM|nr:hypothetical protein EVG20_g9653 [Dentipellis fragilis]